MLFQASEVKLLAQLLGQGKRMPRRVVSGRPVHKTRPPGLRERFPPRCLHSAVLSTRGRGGRSENASAGRGQACAWLRLRADGRAWLKRRAGSRRLQGRGGWRPLSGWSPWRRWGSSSSSMPTPRLWRTSGSRPAGAPRVGRGGAGVAGAWVSESLAGAPGPCRAYGGLREWSRGPSDPRSLPRSDHCQWPSHAATVSV